MSKITLRKQLAQYRAALTVLSDALEYNECPLESRHGCTERPWWCSEHVEVDYYGERSTYCDGCRIEKLSCWEACALEKSGKCSLEQFTHKPPRKYTPARRKSRGIKLMLDFRWR